ncbi:M56 family metallopeptidase [Spirosoma sp. RP8]|uniref:M56 family metallopeptidase n=1 Tax=Spirosoma liriopis TaxID=2937440 RepID=A0ABT0HJP1_9BACT|nr:M56 family metallopeptidase [Spirosoma liriopis]MCK8492386.1 M56 family metallopeptidase [Spirosoma liriopis]
MSGLPYFLIASLYMLLFYGCYWLLLRRNTFFGLNRAYLLSSIALSLVLPLVRLPGGTEGLPIETLRLPAFTVGSRSTQTNTLTIDQWLWLMYGLGVGVMLIRLTLKVRSVLRLIKSGIPQKESQFTLVRLADDTSPSFSFGRYLVLNQTDAQTPPDALLRHEQAHIQQRHTLDILLIELLQAAFWFNPVLRLYKHSLQEVHEFLADRAVLKTPQPDYPQQLVAYALNVPATTLITPFVSKSTLKQRIIMLQKPASNHRALLGYALTLPLAALLTMCTQSEQELPQTAATTSSARKPVKVEGEVFTAVENSPEFPGGRNKLFEYLGQNLKYPESAQKAKAQGKVFVSFIVTKTGEITDVKLEKGIGHGADEEAMRVISQMPNWKPAMQSGKPVNVKFNLPINFQLEDSDKSTAGVALPPPPPPVPSKTASAPVEIARFLINGKPVSKEEFNAFSPDKIARVDVSSKTGTASITTK